MDIVTIESLRRVLSVKRYDVPEFDFNMDMKKPASVKKDSENGATENVDSNVDGDNEASEAKKRRHSKSDVNSYNEDDQMQLDDDETDKPSAKGGVYSSKAINIQPGHTGFLTFATLLHKEY